MATPNPEFDEYASDYQKLLSEPIRNRFASDPNFFNRRKWLLIQDFFSRQKVSPDRLAWLDVGCGQGDLLQFGKGSFARLAGCDPSQQMLSTAAGLEVRPQLDPEKLPFEDASFDFVTAVCVFHHVEPPSRPFLLKEILRVLRPSGFAAIIEHNAYNPLVRGIVSRIAVDANAILLTPREMRDLYSEAGLQPCGTDYFLYLPEPIFRIFGAAEGLGRRIPAGGQYASYARRPA